MKTTTSFLITGFIAMATWGLTGCQSSDTVANSATQSSGQSGSASAESSTNAPSVAVSGAGEASGTNPAEALVGMKTFTIAPAVGGGHSAITGVDGGASRAVVATIQDNFIQRGYVYRENGPTDLVITPKWNYYGDENLAQAETPALPSTATPNTREVKLNVIVKDAATDKVLWSEENQVAVLTTALSPDVAVGMANQALHDLPLASAGGQNANSPVPSSSASSPTPSGQPTAYVQP